MSKKKPVDLPSGCRACNYGRLPHVVTERGAERCTCPRGIALQQRDRARAAKRKSEAHLGAPEHREAPVPKGEV